MTLPGPSVFGRHIIRMFDMKKLTILFLLLPSLALCQLQNYLNKTHRQLLNSPTRSTRMDTIIFTNAVVSDSIIAAIQDIGINADMYSTLSAAIDAAHASAVRKTVVVSTAKTITVTDTLPSDVGLYVQKGGSIAISSGALFRIQGPFVAPRMQVFTGNGLDSVRFLDGSISEIYPEWFGALNDSTTDATAAFQAAFDSSPRRHGTISLNGQGKGYIINSTVYFPRGSSGREIFLDGNGATIISSSADTLFLINNKSNSSNGPRYARHAIFNTWFKRVTGYEDNGIAICINNSVEQLVNFCNFQDFKIGILLLNSYNGTADADSNGWTEGVSITYNRSTSCDTFLSIKKLGRGHESFATTRVEHNSIAMGGASARNKGKRIVGISINTDARVYRCSFDQNYFGLKDSCTAFYSNGRLDGTWGHFGFETFGSGTDQIESYFFDFGSSSVNNGADFFVGYEGLPDTRNFIRSATNKALPTIRTWVKGDGSSESRGLTQVVYDSAATTYLWSLLRSKELDGFKASGATNDSDYTFIAKTTPGRQMTFNFQRSKPLQIFDIDGNLQPTRLLDIGRNRSIQKVGDSTGHLNVNNAIHLILASSTATAGVDTLSKFNGGTIGQLLTVNFSDDSLQVNNLTGGQGNGRIFTVNNRSERMVSGTKSIYKAEAEGSGDGYFWREIARYVPPNASTWNPGNLTSGSVDSTTITVMGAVQGDPVAVGLSSIGTANANIQLWAHVVAINSVRVYARNNSGGTYDIASGTLRVKLLK